MNVFEYIYLALKYKKDPFFVKYLRGRRVLDVGCGRGEFLLKNPQNFIGVDLDLKLIEICNKKGLLAHCQSAFDLDFENESFDVVHASQIIEHFTPSDASRFLEEAARVLKPNGVVFLTTPGVKNVWNTFSHIKPYPPEAFKKLLTSDTENYIRKKTSALRFEDAWGFRFFSKINVIMFIFSILDLLFKPSNPIGWTIVLRKKECEG